MKLKIFEAAVLISIVFLLGDSGNGCDLSCLNPLDYALDKIFDQPVSDFATCPVVKPNGLAKIVDQLAVPPPSGRPKALGLRAALGRPISRLDLPPTCDCGTSTDNGAPLPHPKTSAAVPPPAAAAGSFRQILDGPLSRAAQGPPYRSYGWNDGYVPPTVIHPNIPVPSNSTASRSPSCPPFPPDILLVNHLHNTVTRLGTCPFSVKATIPLVSRPLQVAVTPDGSQAIVTNFDNAISFVNLASNAVSFTLKTDASINPAGVAITPDGKRAYVTSFNNVNSVILVIDIASHTIVGTIPAGAWPQGVFITPDGTQAWVTYPFNNEVDVIDTLTNTESAGRVVNAPAGIAFNSTGTRAYVTSGGNPGTVIAFDTASFQPITSYAVGTYPVDVNVIPGDQLVVVNNFASSNISVINTLSGAVLTSQPADSSAQYTQGLVRIY